MKEISLRQPRRRLMLVLGLGYLVVVVALALAFSDPLAEIVNDMAAGGAKSTGLIAGAVVFVPLLVLLLLSRERIVLRRDAETLIVRRGREERSIRTRDIAGYRVNDPLHTGPLQLLAADGAVLLELNPGLKDFPSALAVAVPDASFAETSRRDVFRGRARVITYGRAAAARGGAA